MTTGEVVSELERSPGWKFDVHWAPKHPTLISSSSLGGSVSLIFFLSSFYFLIIIRVLIFF